jgi:hypothetical protein
MVWTASLTTRCSIKFTLNGHAMARSACIIARVWQAYAAAPPFRDSKKELLFRPIALASISGATRSESHHRSLWRINNWR